MVCECTEVCVCVCECAEVSVWCVCVCVHVCVFVRGTPLSMFVHTHMCSMMHI